jgi:hypothetical protein
MSAGPIRYLPRQAGTSVSVRIVNGAMRASVGSTDASASLPARVGVVGPTRATWPSIRMIEDDVFDIG